MRLTSTVTSGLSAAAALVLLTACGGSDTEDTAATSASSAGSSAAATSSSAPAESEPDEETLTFCTEAEAVIGGLAPQLEAATPQTIPGVLQQLVDAFDTLAPPADIAGDFGTLRDSYATLLDATTTTDVTTPEGEAAFQAVFTEVQGEAEVAQENLATWTEANCPNVGGAAPTS